MAWPISQRRATLASCTRKDKAVEVSSKRLWLKRSAKEPDSERVRARRAERRALGAPPSALLLSHARTQRARTGKVSRPKSAQPAVAQMLTPIQDGKAIGQKMSATQARANKTKRPLKRSTNTLKKAGSLRPDPPSR